jgi:hypothetical protein
MSYTKDQVIDYLNTQDTIKNAIENIDYINKPNRKVMYDGKVAFYIHSTITNRGQLKSRLIKHMEDNAWEKSGYEEIMSLDELLESLEMEVV